MQISDAHLDKGSPFHRSLSESCAALRLSEMLQQCVHADLPHGCCFLPNHLRRLPQTDLCPLHVGADPHPDPCGGQ